MASPATQIFILLLINLPLYLSFQWLSLGMLSTSTIHSEDQAGLSYSNLRRSLNDAKSDPQTRLFNSVSHRKHPFPTQLTTKFKFSKSDCKLLLGLSKRQVRVCRRDVQHMRSVSTGAHSALIECQWQFRARRWNCTTIDRSTLFGATLGNDTREAAFVHAIAAAGVAQQVTRDCSRGHLDKCGCDQSPVNGAHATRRTRSGARAVGSGFRWSGCSDNVHYGVAFTRRFVDAAERTKKQPLDRMLINLHNIEAGRQALVRHMRLQCKCHGVGDVLKSRFDGATEVRLRRWANGERAELVKTRASYKTPTRADLVYTTESPDYCDAKIGSMFSTKGRRCNANSEGIDGCKLLCCHRGFDSHIETMVDKQCHCKFVFCCKVECQTCVTEEVVNVCR